MAMNNSISTVMISNLTTYIPSTNQPYINREILPTAVDHLVKFAFVVVAVLGLTGNGFIFYLFASKRVKLTAFNVLLLNLSISDAIADISIWPYVFVDLKSFRGLDQSTADQLCFVTMGQMTYWIATVASLFTLTVISLSRYAFIHRPMKARFFNKRHASLIVVLMIWPVSFSMCLPSLFSLRYNEIYAVCERDWPKGIHGQAYSAITAVLGYVFPAVVMTFTFITTRQQLWLNNNNNIIRSACSVRRRKKASMLLGALVIAFFVCWGPFFVYWILSRTATSIFPQGPEGDYSRMRTILFVVLISLCNTVADPIIYGLRGEDFRKCLLEMKNSIPYFAAREQARARTRARTKSSECPDNSCDLHHLHLQRV